MKKYEKEILQSQLNSEKRALEELKRAYKKASQDCADKIAALSARTDMENLQSIIYQKQYQQTLKKQIDGILDVLHGDEFETISAYLQACYEDGFISTMYSLTLQGIPLIVPIDQTAVVRAIQTDSKISKGLYERLGEDVAGLKTNIRAEISRGISNGSTYNEIATKIAMGMNSPFKKAINNAIRITRTEGNRISNKSAMDAMYIAKEKGADQVKQWCAALDSRTRSSHRRLDGQIREIDEAFLNGLQYPLDPKGEASEVVNCRCTILKRARWALGEEELNTLKERAEYYGLDKTEEFEEYKKKYLKAVEYEGGIPKGWKTIDTTKDDAVKNTNPKYGTGAEYSRNCPNCACAYEMRKRGYDVVARPYTKGGSHYLNSYPWEAWKNADVQTITNKKDLIAYTQKQGNGARFGMAIEYYNNSGHVIVGEVVDDVLKLYDVQTGKEIIDIDFSNINDVKLWKTNELDASDRGITACEGR